MQDKQHLQFLATHHDFSPPPEEQQIFVRISGAEQQAALPCRVKIEANAVGSLCYAVEWGQGILKWVML